ncbi:MAG: tetratricopeptide repeat protein, partial [Nitrospirae bacterium]
MKKTWKYDFNIARFSKAIEANPKDYLAYKDRGNAYYKKKQYDLAIADYVKALELNP